MIMRTTWLAFAAATAVSWHTALPMPQARAAEVTDAIEQALAPMLDNLPSGAELASVKTAVQAAFAKDFVKATSIAQGLRDPAARAS